MTATEELRRMLDERGVEHSDFASAYRLSTRWQDSGKRVIEHQLRKDADIGDMGIVRNLTPAQAIAATLGNNDTSRWYKLFGTPERAARTLGDYCYNMVSCAECCIRCEGKRFEDGDALLEWLRGDA